MAKLSAHGAELGRIDFLTYRKAYMADGAVLKNSGSGWKLTGKLKHGVDPAEYFPRKLAEVNTFRAGRPAYSAYLRELHSLTSMANRWKLHAAVKMMPDDCDGVWSSVVDDYQDPIHADVDEIAELCKLYNLACAESAEFRKSE